MILNMNGGSAGGGKSAIIVTAPAGSTVTCSMGDAVKTVMEKDGTWTFRGLDNGTWTVTAALGAESSSRDVTITRLTVEYVTLEYKTYLIQSGVFVNEEITGGWLAEGKKRASNSTAVAHTPTVTQNSGHILLNQSSGGSGYYHTVNAVDFTDVSRIVFDGYLTNNNKAIYCILGCYDGSALPGFWGVDFSAAELTANLGEKVHGTYNLDVSALSGSYFIGFGLDGPTSEVRIDNLYLE